MLSKSYITELHSHFLLLFILRYLAVLVTRSDLEPGTWDLLSFSVVAQAHAIALALPPINFLDSGLISFKTESSIISRLLSLSQFIVRFFFLLFFLFFLCVCIFGIRCRPSYMLNMHTAIELLLLYYYFKTTLNSRSSCFSLLNSEIAGLSIHIWYMKLFLFWGAVLGIEFRAFVHAWGMFYHWGLYLFFCSLSCFFLNCISLCIHLGVYMYMSQPHAMACVDSFRE